MTVLRGETCGYLLDSSPFFFSPSFSFLFLFLSLLFSLSFFAYLRTSSHNMQGPPIFEGARPRGLAYLQLRFTARVVVRYGLLYLC
jgi:hypothetical protein